MRDLAILHVHLLSTIARLIGLGGARAVVAESLLVKHQLLVVNRSRQRAPNLRPMEDRYPIIANLSEYRWQPHCRGLYQLPVAA